MTIESDALNKLALGRGYVLSRADYIAGTLLEMTPIIVSAPSITMGITRGLVLYVNGEWILKDPEMQSDEVTGGCLYHECEHPLRGMDRLEALPNKSLANIAGDEGINFNLREERWQLPSWVVYPESFNHPGNLTLEQYYALLEKQQDAAKKNLDQFMDDCMNGQKPPPVDGDADSEGKKGKGKSKKGGGKDQDHQQPGGGSGGQGKGWQKKVGAGYCGSGGGNTDNSQLEQDLDAAYGKCEAEVEAVRQSTLDDIEQHMQQFGCGSIPGRFNQILEARIQPPRVDWKRELRKALRYSCTIISGARNYSMRRPSIGGALAGVCSSGLVDNEVRVALIEDTSLSMGTPQLQESRSEGYHVLKKLGLREAWHIQADSVVQKVQKIKLRQMPHVSFAGRGGTNFIPVFEELMKMRPRPNLAVFFTDGDGPAPPKPPPGIQTVWCIVRTPHARRPAWWGKVVVCDKSQELHEPYKVEL